MDLFWILGFSVLVSVGGVIAAAGFLLIPQETRQALLPYLISYATGALLTTALLKLLPHAIEHIGAKRSLTVVLVGLGVFFILEHILIWRHCHLDAHCETHRTSGTLILIGDGFHNFVDGVIMAAAFLTSIPLGIAAALAVIAHEIPQEVGDFAILLDSGYTRRQAFWANLLSGCATILGAAFGVGTLAFFEAPIPYMLAVSAAGFLYIGLADLVPGLHTRLRMEIGNMQLFWMVLGCATILWLPSH
ncbi:MAG: ZIP family metal transporter [Nitrospirae bacterium]|nr:MAG: ZIP family metal transporter [Nitrospirota bacterium]